MEERLRERLRRSAVLGVVALVAAALATGLAPGNAAVAIVLLVVFVWQMLGWGPYNVHVERNGTLSVERRAWWRVGLYLLPAAAFVAYWFRHVREDGERLTRRRTWVFAGAGAGLVLFGAWPDIGFEDFLSVTCRVAEGQGFSWEARLVPAAVSCVTADGPAGTARAGEAQAALAVVAALLVLARGRRGATAALVTATLLVVTGLAAWAGAEAGAVLLVAPVVAGGAALAAARCEGADVLVRRVAPLFVAGSGGWLAAMALNFTDVTIGAAAPAGLLIAAGLDAVARRVAGR